MKEGKPMTTHTPIIIVHKIEDGKTQFEINLAEFFADDPMTFGPVIPGIILSDLLDHIVNALHQVTDRDERDIRADILKAMRDEDCFKEKDPSRSGMQGGLVKVDHGFDTASAKDLQARLKPLIRKTQP